MSEDSTTVLRVGTRVVVRHRITDAEHALTDAVGDVVERTDDAVVIRTRRGDVRVELADVVAAKPVPPAPARRAPRRPPA
ncbi:hypothetical protein [Litorihabitans aurantiacus]|uniref:Histone acetyltransferase Rv0428c-like SH3 domain-containing protein n=1 Tax=Litorihabitans aurantiacus TaxID=1930061 RepID=A0AA37UU68_9MICO|nr:hypothetical protein [Litorihabitans aurantiacus]GMA30582.1 hypothetical protein GCM10025875_05740 [Litorihabitans aurantiacus]